MSLRLVARLLERPYTTVWDAVQRLNMKPYRVGATCYLNWSDVGQLAEYLSTRPTRLTRSTRSTRSRR